MRRVDFTEPDPALADRRQQLLEARAGNAGAGTAQIVVDHFDRGPAQGARTIGQAHIADVGSRDC